MINIAIYLTLLLVIITAYLVRLKVSMLLRCNVCKQRTQHIISNKGWSCTKCR